MLEEALSAVLDDPRVLVSLEYVAFWRTRFGDLEGIPDTYQKGEYLSSQWYTFLAYMSQARHVARVDIMVNALRRCVFRHAIAFYREVYQERTNRDATLLLQIGRCYKGAGEYDTAMRFLKAASAKEAGNAQVLAELADVCSLVNETAQAKVFFREAFFIDPQAIDIGRLESEIILGLAQRLRGKGIYGKELKEWIPVYGVLFDVLNVKRELRSIEFGRLQQAIFEMERERREKLGDPALIVPRLINRYFWLIDHYVAAKEAQGKIDDVLIKIRSVSEDVYSEYTN